MIVGIPSLGLRGCYVVDAASFAGSLYGLGRLPSVAPVPTAAAARTIDAVAEGIAYVARHPRLCGAFLADLSATVFALPLSLFPAINAERFAGDPHTLGLFTASVGVGGLLSTLLSGPVVRFRRQGLAMIVAVAVWGAGFAAFAVVPGLALTLLALAIAGAADTITVVMRGAIVQSAVDESMRGRVTAVDYVVGLCGGQIGSLESGALGSLTSPAFSALSGGLATILAAALIGLGAPWVRPRRRAQPVLSLSSSLLEPRVVLQLGTPRGARIPEPGHQQDQRDEHDLSADADEEERPPLLRGVRGRLGHGRPVGGERLQRRAERGRRLDQRGEVRGPERLGGTHQEPLVGSRRRR